MIQKYVNSTEEYFGFTLKVVMTCLDERRRNFHRTCEAYKDGKCVAIGKTKKEIKDLISNGYIK